MILTMMMIQKIYMSQMCDTCSIPVFQNGHCDGGDDDYDDGDDDDTLSVRTATAADRKWLQRKTRVIARPIAIPTITSCGLFSRTIIHHK